MTNAYQNPLSNMTNEELIDLFHTSESNFVKDDVLAQLLKNNQGILVQIADKYKNIPNIDWVDRIGELNIAMVKAVRDFDVNKGYKFITMLRSYCIRAMDKQYEIQTREKRFNPEVKSSSYEVLLELQKDGGQELELSLDTTTYTDVELHYLLQNLQLSKNEMAVCILLSKGESKSDIARALNVSATMVNKYVKKIRLVMELGGVI